MRSLYDIRRELVKYKQNLKEINRLIVSSKPSIKLYRQKEIIKLKIEELEKEYEQRKV
jgi:hypothetical protein